MKTPPTHVLTIQEIEALAQEEKYRAQIEIIRKIATPKGFYEYFFSLLPTKEFKTRTEVFDYVNELHRELFGDYKYSCYESFLKSCRNL